MVTHVILRKTFRSSNDLIVVAGSSLRDAANCLQCICKLNALPLAFHITQVAGNVMSQMFLGAEPKGTSTYCFTPSLKRDIWFRTRSMEPRTRILPKMIKIWGQEGKLVVEESRSTLEALCLNPKRDFMISSSS